MTTAPRTFTPDEPLDDLEASLDHIHLHLLASPLTEALAPPIGKLLASLPTIRAERAALARALFALRAKEIFHDDELNKVLDDVKEALSADKSEAGVAFYKDVFEGKSPSEIRKFILGPQLTTMSVWHGKLTGSSTPGAQKLGDSAKQATDKAVQLLNDIGAAEAALDQYDFGPRAAFVDSCNAAVKSTFGKLAEMVHAPPNGPLPQGFVDRFFLRDTSARVPTVTSLEAAVARTKAKLARQEGLLTELKDKQAKDKRAKQQAALAEKTAAAEAAQKAAAEAAAALTKLKEEIAKEESA